MNTSKNWQIYFDLSSDSDINSQLTKLNLLLNGGISADDMKNLHYIDFRPKDRAIICDNATCGEWKSKNNRLAAAAAFLLPEDTNCGKIKVEIWESQLPLTKYYY